MCQESVVVALTEIQDASVYEILECTLLSGDFHYITFFDLKIKQYNQWMCKRCMIDIVFFSFFFFWFVTCWR